MSKLYIEPVSELAQLPEYQTTYAAGMDIRACTKWRNNLKTFDYSSAYRDAQGKIQAETIPVEKDGGFMLMPNMCVLIPTGIKLQPQEDMAELLLPRSGLGIQGIILANTVGLIDPDYADEMLVALYNRTKRGMLINHGDRICQMVMLPILRVQPEFVTELPELYSNREGGFGSSGRG